MSRVQQRIGYSSLFWLFMLGSLPGVLLEGVFCLFCHGYWATPMAAVCKNGFVSGVLSGKSKQTENYI
ncbi:MAG: hypothetical protein NC427_09200 [Ruminococcus flavefaciens]|nr:hypothetical protein [Ruminococcus flavefaciens]